VNKQMPMDQKMELSGHARQWYRSIEIEEGVVTPECIRSRRCDKSFAMSAPRWT